jgi:hypothetical protein
MPPARTPAKARLSKRAIFLIIIGVLLLNVVLIVLIWGQSSNSESPSAAPIEIVPAADQQIVKIHISQSGIQRITPEDLAKLGWQAEPGQVRLSLAGTPLPHWQGEGNHAGEIYFFVELGNSRYFADEIVLMERVEEDQSTLSMAASSTSVGLEQAQDSVLVTDRFEENASYYPQAAGFDNWFWTIFPSPQSLELSADWSVAAGTAGRYRLQLYSTTENATLDPDHHLQLWINDVLVGDHYWDGQDWQLLSGIIPAEAFRSGAQTIRIEAPGDTGSLVDISQLDWLEIDYPTAANTDAFPGRFFPTGAALRLLSLDERPLVVSIEPSGHWQETARATWPAPAQDDWILETPAETVFFAAAPLNMHRPSRIEPLANTIDLSDFGIAAQYVVIGPDDLLAVIEPLLSHREDQGLSTVTVPISAVFDQFNFGRAEPEGILNFLKYAYQHWGVQPEYVLLLGDASHDQKGYQSDAAINAVPSFSIETLHGGETSSDLLYAYLDDDDVPDLSIGRVPARDADQVAAFIDKTLDYEANLPEPEAIWSRRILAVADNSEARFHFDAQTFLDQFNADFEPVLYAPEPGTGDANATIASQLDEGVLFMSYFGHGSVLQWGKESLFTTEDGQTLENTRLPIMINITCLAGLFTHPTVNSLAETMLLNPSGGAVAALAATSLTTPPDQAVLTRALVEALNDNPDLTLGKIILMAQQQVAPDAQSGAREVLETFLLFGDPALRLASSSGD